MDRSQSSDIQQWRPAPWSSEVEEEQVALAEAPGDRLDNVEESSGAPESRTFAWSVSCPAEVDSGVRENGAAPVDKRVMVLHR